MFIRDPCSLHGLRNLHQGTYNFSDSFVTGYLASPHPRDHNSIIAFVTADQTNLSFS